VCCGYVSTIASQTGTNPDETDDYKPE